MVVVGREAGRKPGQCGVMEAKRNKRFQAVGAINWIQCCQQVNKDEHFESTIGIDNMEVIADLDEGSFWRAVGTKSI